MLGICFHAFLLTDVLFKSRGTAYTEEQRNTSGELRNGLRIFVQLLAYRQSVGRHSNALVDWPGSDCVYRRSRDVLSTFGRYAGLTKAITDAPEEPFLRPIGLYPKPAMLTQILLCLTTGIQ